MSVGGGGGGMCGGGEILQFAELHNFYTIQLHPGNLQDTLDRPVIFPSSWTQKTYGFDTFPKEFPSPQDAANTSVNTETVSVLKQ